LVLKHQVLVSLQDLLFKQGKNYMLKETIAIDGFFLFAYIT